jgi:hypothetical protein
MEGKFFGEEGDDWTCPTCAYGNCSCDNTSDEEEDPAEEIKAQIKHLLADLETAEGRGGVQRFITEELRYLF